ncbi:hypothetical protein [Methanosarcina acetivorans]|uniref:Uncharacterized protein n=1 Tax=Methanosarcina acetivorans (strain ATCC 35395 / DSM 2834 / JCM 12185 / C2A) TaxID=188937 RepID=Q8TM65_METAC|nr:hypothetical protein [Methanosarcina acetivorans]AAM06182.1 predicted protein [Methanosarcina acetivorans C2A]
MSDRGEIVVLFLLGAVCVGTYALSFNSVVNSAMEEPEYQAGYQDGLTGNDSLYLDSFNFTFPDGSFFIWDSEEGFKVFSYRKGFEDGNTIRESELKEMKDTENNTRILKLLKYRTNGL